MSVIKTSPLHESKGDILYLPLFKVSDINVLGCVYLFADVAAILPALFYALGKQVFDLTVDGAEIRFRPRGEIVIQLFGQSQRDLLLNAHQYKLPELTTGCAS